MADKFQAGCTEIPIKSFSHKQMESSKYHRANNEWQLGIRRQNVIQMMWTATYHNNT